MEFEDEPDQPLFCVVHSTTADGTLTFGVAVLSRCTSSTSASPSSSTKSKTQTPSSTENRLVELFEFQDCSQLANLESLLVRFNPGECLIDESLGAEKEGEESSSKKTSKSGGLGRRILRLLETVGVKAREVSKKLFRGERLEQDLLFLLGESRVKEERDVCEKSPLASRALAALIVEEGLAEDEDFRERLRLQQSHLSNHMRLDAAAVHALNLFPSSTSSSTTSSSRTAGGEVKESSLEGVLDHCKTKKIGVRLLRRWLRQPLVDLAAIERRQDVVGALKEDDQRRQGVQDALRGVPDIERLLKRFESGKAGLKEMYELYLFVELLPRIANTLTLNETGDLEAPRQLQEIGRQVEDLCAANRFQKYVELVESVLDLDLAPAEFRVKPVHDETGELAELAEKLQRIDREKEEIRANLEEDHLCDMNPKFETDPSMLKTYGYHFRINKKEDNKLKKVKCGKYLVVVAACIRWGTTELKSLYEEYAETYALLQKKQAAIIQQAAQVAASFLPLFESASAVIAELDVLASFAHASAFAGETGYVRPKLAPIGAPDRVIRLTRSRHPCLEMLDNVEFIANDYELDPTKNNFQIITGPNMGGKSTYIRQLGTILVMAQIGCFVPCEEAEIPIVDAVLARVGASDSQMRGVSTFMAEMIEASAIVKTATKNSLVIIDELGRGTSTYDGFGLAWAISEYLATQIAPFCLFATHFHELTALADHVPTVTNKHVTALASNETITMLYTVNEGPCEQSFGINIAKMAGFPDDVVESAKRKADALESLVVIASKSAENQSKRMRLEKARDAIKAFAAMPKDKALDPKALRQVLDIAV